jgi:hypothetical protein
MKRFLASTLLALVGVAHAEFLTGNSLLALAQSSDPVRNGQAVGYVAGVHDVGQGVNHCTPDTVTALQLFDLTRITLENAPAERNRTADVLVLAVLRAKWPCKRPAASPGVVL